MCLLSFAWQPQSETPLTLVSNRDEFHQRPTAASDFWPEHPHLLAGKDLEAGGTWMGVTKGGRFAALTNVRQLPSSYQGRASRGKLVKDALCSSESPEAYLYSINASEYDGFNLIVGNRNECWYLSNRLPDPSSQPQQLKPGIYGLSNAQLDTPWPKTMQAKQALANWLALPQDNRQPLYSLLNSTDTYASQQLPNTGIGEPWETLLSSAFIISPEYGTRACTGLQIHQAFIEWQEASMNGKGERESLVKHTL